MPEIGEMLQSRPPQAPQRGGERTRRANGTGSGVRPAGDEGRRTRRARRDAQHT